MKDNAKYRPTVLKDYKPLNTLLPLESPLALHISTTTRCNFRCKFCFREHDLREGALSQGCDMPFELVEKIAKDIAEFKEPISVVDLSYCGESLLYPSLACAIKLLKNTNKIGKTKIISNGSLLSKAKADELMSAGLDTISISLNGLSNEQIKLITQTTMDDLYDTIYSNIKYLYSIRGNCHIHIKIISDFFSEDEQKQFLDTFTPISDSIYIEHLCNQWLNIDLSTIAVPKKVSRHGHSISKENLPICGNPFCKLWIAVDGKVSACADDWEFLMNIGNITKHSLKQIWNNEKISDLRKSWLTRSNMHPQCGKCRYYEHQLCEDLAPYSDELIRKYGYDK